MKMTWTEVTEIKIWDIKIVDTYIRIAPCEFQIVWILDVSLTGSQTSKFMQVEVRSLNVTWRRELWGHRVIVFWKCVKLLAEQLWQIWRRYAPRWGGGADNRPPAVRRLTRAPLGGISSPPPLVFLRYLLNLCRYHYKTCSTLTPNIFTHCVKILKFRVS